MQEGLVSVIIPVFNRALMLTDAVRSALDQTYRPLEIVIVDDGSTDDTAAVADRFAQAHAEIRVLHKANSGVGAARESGRDVIHGEFVQYLDSDDLLLPRKLELQVAALRAQREAGVAYGRIRYRDPEGREIACHWKPANQAQTKIFPSFLVSRWWDTVAPLYRRSVTDQAGPWTDLRIEEDWEYDCRIGALGVTLVGLDDYVAEVRDHAEERLSGRAGSDPARLRDRARAHLLITSHARHAGVDPSSPEFQHFARELFHMGRQCGAAGLADESQDLVAAARGISSAQDLRIYEFVAKMVGWSRVARVAAWMERLR